MSLRDGFNKLRIKIYVYIIKPCKTHSSNVSLENVPRQEKGHRWIYLIKGLSGFSTFDVSFSRLARAHIVESMRLTGKSGLSTKWIPSPNIRYHDYRNKIHNMHVCAYEFVCVCARAN